MTYIRSNGGKLKFAQDVVAKLSTFRQTRISDPEAGGILLGRLIEGSTDVVLDEVTIPQKRDRWGRLFFRRNKKQAQAFVDLAWKSSGKARIYLGEWHTHPEDDPTPSQQDIQNWHSISTNAVYEQDFLFFFIVGINKTGVWEIEKNTRVLVELQLSE